MLLTILLLPHLSYADWWGDAIRISCIPELDYFTITKHPIEETHEMFKDGYPHDAFTKYGFIINDDVKEYTCELSNDMVIKAEFEYYRDPRQFPPYSCHGSAQPHRRLKLLIAHKTKAQLTGEYYLGVNEIITWHCSFGMVKELVNLTYHSQRIIIDWVYSEETHEHEIIWFSDLRKTNFSE